jgi:hypothetical protein
MTVRRRARMTFVVHIWKQPAVATVEDADAVIGRLAAHAAAQPEPLLDALQDSLLARYPADIDSRDADPVWLDSLRPPREPANHLSLGIATARVDGALPFLIDAANRLGLYVYDPQNARVNRPDGVVLGKPMPRAAAATRASGSSARVRAREPEVQRQLLAMLEPVMKSHGFRTARIHHDGVGFKRVAGACQHTIELMVFDESGGVRINALLNSEDTDFTAEIHRAVPPRTERASTCSKDHCRATCRPRARTMRSACCCHRATACASSGRTSARPPPGKSSRCSTPT